MAEVTFAVGDVHGRADLLAELQQGISREASRLGASNPKVVYLGDYVDKGPSSRQVLDLVLDGLPNFERQALMGNHEDMLRSFLDGPTDRGALKWFRNGGSVTLASYGIEIGTRDFMSDLAGVRDWLLDVMPSAHREAILGNAGAFLLLHEDARAIYVHAGLRPEVDLGRQDRHDLLWIRDDFLESPHDWGKLVVHGHTPTSHGPDSLPNRVNLDTGAYATGALTAVVLDGEAPRFLVAAQRRPWHLIVDPCGERDDAWLSWNVSRAAAAGARMVGLCMPEVAACRAASLCQVAGIPCKPLSQEGLASAWSDRASPLATALSNGSASVTFSGFQAEEEVLSMVNVRRRAEATTSPLPG